MAERELYGNGLEPAFPFEQIRGRSPDIQLIKANSYGFRNT